LGAVLYVARRYEDAADVLANVTHAGFWYRCYLAASYAQLGRIEEAKELVQEARRLREDCSLSKLRVKDLGLGGYDLLIEGLRKAGMPE
jgi:adenylate cyclase